MGHGLSGSASFDRLPGATGRGSYLGHHRMDGNRQLRHRRRCVPGGHVRSDDTDRAVRDPEPGVHIDQLPAALDDHDGARSCALLRGQPHHGHMDDAGDVDQPRGEPLHCERRGRLRRHCRRAHRVPHRDLHGIDRCGQHGHRVDQVEARISGLHPAPGDLERCGSYSDHRHWRRVAVDLQGAGRSGRQLPDHLQHAGRTG